MTTRDEKRPQRVANRRERPPNNHKPLPQTNSSKITIPKLGTGFVKEEILVASRQIHKSRKKILVECVI